MAININIYPEDFTEQSNSNKLTLQNAVDAIQVQARDTALRLAHTRRISGQNEIFNLQKDASVNFKLLPLSHIGKVQTKPLVLGSVAYLGGAYGTFNNIEKFHMGNEIFQLTGARLISPRCYMGTVGNAESGKFCGGHDGANSQDHVEKFIFSKETLSLLSVRTSEPVTAPAGGMGTSEVGILAGGVPNTLAGVYNYADFYNHALDTIAKNNNFLIHSRAAPHNGISSQYAGYIYGGFDSWSGIGVNSIEKIAYTNIAWTSTLTSITIPHFHAVHAAFGNSIAGYLAGGSNASPPSSNWLNSGQKISRFTYSGESLAFILAEMRNPIVCADGAGSSANGYIIGGNDQHWGTISTVNKLRYDTETLIPVISVTKIKTADQGIVSDYNPGWSEF